MCRWEFDDDLREFELLIFNEVATCLVFWNFSPDH